MRLNPDPAANQKKMAGYSRLMVPGGLSGARAVVRA